MVNCDQSLKWQSASCEYLGRAPLGSAAITGMQSESISLVRDHQHVLAEQRLHQLPKPILASHIREVWLAAGEAPSLILVKDTQPTSRLY
jgi:hypothetical protein